MISACFSACFFAALYAPFAAGSAGEPAPTATAPAPAATAPTIPDATELRDEADAVALEALLRDQQKLFAEIAGDPKNKSLPHAEKERRLTDISRRYERLLARAPDDPALMVLYAKFLRLVDDRAAANEWFAKADRLMPDTAVIKHQLGAYAAEEGRHVVAHNLLEQAVTLEPRVAIYHFHFAEFLVTYREHLVKDCVFKTDADCAARFRSEFARAAALAPENHAYAWRHAESFFDGAQPDNKGALAAWERLAVRTKDDLERETAVLQQVRALIGLKLYKQARERLAVSKSPRLAASRKKLEALLPAQ
jgi:tetratricopeptide (TPR) repeat protein